MPDVVGLMMRKHALLSGIRLRATVRRLFDATSFELFCGEDPQWGDLPCVQLSLPCQKHGSPLLRFWFLLVSPWQVAWRVRSRVRLLIGFDMWSAACLVPTAIIRRSPLAIVQLASGSVQQGGAAKWFRRWTLRRAAAVFVADETAFNELLTAGVQPERAHFVAFPPFDTELDGGSAPERLTRWQEWRQCGDERREALCERYAVPEGATLVAVLDPLTHREPVECLLRSLSGIEREPVLLWICGDGPERSSLEALRVGLGLSATVRFVAEPAEILAVLAGVDVTLALSPAVANSGTDLADLVCFTRAVMTADTAVAQQTGLPPESRFERLNVQAMTTGLLPFIESAAVRELVSEGTAAAAERILEQNKARFADVIGRLA